MEKVDFDMFSFFYISEMCIRDRYILGNRGHGVDLQVIRSKILNNDDTQRSYKNLSRKESSYYLG